MQGISQWVTQNPKATITRRAAATLPELLPAIPALSLWEKPRGEELLPPALRHLLPGKGKQVFSAGMAWEKCQECHGVGEGLT